LNSGSSTLKYALFRTGVKGEERLAGDTIEREGDHETAVRAAGSALERDGWPKPDAIGHRVVHGGPEHFAPARVDGGLLDSLRRAAPFAPLHLPAEIGVIEAAATLYPGVPQVACFDTAFFRDLPEVARRFALPRALYERGIRRYGFHGLSYEYVVESLGSKLDGRAIVAHLGNGASMAALVDRKPVDTTMGLTPAGGFMMGTRPGDLDPGVLLHLLDQGHDARSLEKIVNHESGLLGVSGETADVKTLLEHRPTDERAALAIEMFAYQAKKTIGALGAALGGLDTLVFTGGIGEHAAPVRELIVAGLEGLGVRIDAEKNRRGADVISPDDGRSVVRVVPTDEERMIARHTARALGLDRNQ
jgi:acetate kinase